MTEQEGNPFSSPGPHGPKVQIAAFAGGMGPAAKPHPVHERPSLAPRRQETRAGAGGPPHRDHTTSSPVWHPPAAVDAAACTRRHCPGATVGAWSRGPGQSHRPQAAFRCVLGVPEVCHRRPLSNDHWLQLRAPKREAAQRTNTVVGAVGGHGRYCCAQGSKMRHTGCVIHTLACQSDLRARLRSNRAPSSHRNQGPHPTYHARGEKKWRPWP